MIDPEDPFDFVPFSMKRNATFAAYFDDDTNDGNPSYVRVAGEVKMPQGFTKQTIDGVIVFRENGSTSFDGKARFVGTTIDVEGDITPSRVQFEGSVSHSWNIGAGKIKTTVTAEFDSRDTEVDLDVKAQICAAGKCDSINGSASVNGDGKIRGCARVSGKERCDTL